MKWMDAAVCRKTYDLRAGSEYVDERDDFITECCQWCPVQRQCLEFGAARHTEHRQMVWGGVYFPKKKEARIKAIEKRRGELDADQL